MHLCMTISARESGLSHVAQHVAVEMIVIVLQMREAVRATAGLFPTSIISGRGREKVQSFVQLKDLFYAGSHGMDIVGPKVSYAITIVAQTLSHKCCCLPSMQTKQLVEVRVV